MKRTFKILYAIPACIISYPIFAFAMTMLGILTLFAFMATIVGILGYPVLGKTFLKEALEMLVMPFVLPFVIWYEWAINDKNLFKDM